MNTQHALLVSTDTIKTLTQKYSIQQIAEHIGTSYDTVNNAVKRVFPELIKNGIKTELTEEQVTIVLEEIKNNQKTMEQLTFEAGSKVNATTTQMTPALKIKKAFELMQEGYEEELARLKDQIAVDAPKVAFFDQVTDSTDAVDMAEVAKVLNYSAIGRNKLFEILRCENILMGNNLPYQRFIDMGLFRVVESKFVTASGETHINMKTVVYQKGIDYIRQIINKYTNQNKSSFPLRAYKAE